MSAPVLCVTAILTDGARVALVRSKKPGRAWELPGGKVGPKDGGDWQQAMTREVEEETGIFVPAAAWSVVGVLTGKPVEGAAFASTIIVARLKTISGLPLRAGSDAAEAAWFERGALPEHLSPLQSRDALLAWNAERPAVGITAEELQEVETVSTTWPAEREDLVRIAAARPGVFHRLAATERANRSGLTEEQADAIALGCLQVRADLQQHAIKRAILRVDRGETGLADVDRENERADATRAAYEAALAEDPTMPRRAWRAATFAADVSREAMCSARRELVKEAVKGRAAEGQRASPRR